MILELIQNVALLVTLATGLHILAGRLEGRAGEYRILMGLLFGVTGIAGMMTPMQFAPGVIYDGRSIVLSLAGLFCGPLAATLSALLCAAYRLYLGGAGAVAGVAVIAESAALGVLLHHLRRKNEAWVRPARLLAFAFLVHLIMLLLQLLIPGKGLDILYTIAPSVLFFYPLGFLVTAQVFLESERRRTAVRLLQESEERYRAIAEDMPALVCRSLPDTTLTYVNTAYCRYFQKSAEELTGSRFLDLIPKQDRDEVTKNLAALTPDCPACSHEHPVISPTHGIRWQRWTNRALFDGAGQAISFQSVGEDITEKRTALEAVQESEERFREIAATVREVFWICSPDWRTVYYVSPAYEKVWGLSRQRLYESPTSGLKLIHPEDRKALFREIIRRIRGDYSVPEFAEYRVIAADGKPRWVLTRAYPVYGKKGKITRVVGITEDVNDRHCAETALQAETIQRRAIFEQSPDGILIIEPETAGFIEFNTAAHKQLGYSREEFARLTIFDIEAMELREGTKARIAQVCREGKAEFETLQRTRTGELRNVNVRAQVIDIQGKSAHHCVWHDITERKRSEEALRLQAQILDQIQDMVTATDLQGNITYVNNAEARNMGCAKEDILGRNVTAYGEDSTRGATQQQIIEGTLESGSWRGEVVNRNAQGHEIIIDCRTSLIRDQEGRPIGMCGIGTDITGRTQLEAQLRQAQKMEAVGQLTGGVAHDFNNLLQVIINGAELALEDIGAGHPAQESLAEVVKASQRAARLVSQLLLFSRRKVMRPEILNLDETVADLLKMLRRLIGEHIALEWHPSGRKDYVNADRGMVEQVLVNLAINARDAMPAGGTLTIATNVLVAGEDYCRTHPEASPGRYVILTVADNGCGMKPDQIGHIFEPFYTTKALGEGTGLGLSTVYGIIKQHGGLIEVHSEWGEGSTFELCWPVCAAAPAKIEPETDHRVAGGKETILVAEDDDTVRRMLRSTLKLAGYTVICAAHGGEAVQLVKEIGNTIDLVVLDVLMPGMGGREAYEKIQAMCPALKAVFLSGYSEGAVHTGFVLDKGLTLIEKPVARDVLLRSVREALDA